MDYRVGLEEKRQFFPHKMGKNRQKMYYHKIDAGFCKKLRKRCVHRCKVWFAVVTVNATIVKFYCDWLFRTLKKFFLASLNILLKFRYENYSSVSLLATAIIKAEPPQK
jgi:hypothetical protein